jgi:hypothetical protein
MALEKQSGHWTVGIRLDDGVFQEKFIGTPAVAPAAITAEKLPCDKLTSPDPFADAARAMGIK